MIDTAYQPLTEKEKKLLLALPDEGFDISEMADAMGVGYDTKLKLKGYATETKLTEKGKMAKKALLLQSEIEKPISALSSAHSTLGKAMGAISLIASAAAESLQHESLFASIPDNGCTCAFKKGYKGHPVLCVSPGCPVHASKTPPGWKKPLAAPAILSKLSPEKWSVSPALKIEHWSFNDQKKVYEIQIACEPQVFQFLAMELDLGELLGKHPHYLGSYITSIHVTEKMMVRFYLICPYKGNAAQVMREALEAAVSDYQSSTL